MADEEKSLKGNCSKYNKLIEKTNKSTKLRTSVDEEDISRENVPLKKKSCRTNKVTKTKNTRDIKSSHNSNRTLNVPEEMPEVKVKLKGNKKKSSVKIDFKDLHKSFLNDSNVSNLSTNSDKHFNEDYDINKSLVNNLTVDSKNCFENSQLQGEISLDLLSPTENSSKSKTKGSTLPISCDFRQNLKSYGGDNNTNVESELVENDLKSSAQLTIGTEVIDKRCLGDCSNFNDLSIICANNKHKNRLEDNFRNDSFEHISNSAVPLIKKKKLASCFGSKTNSTSKIIGRKKIKLKKGIPTEFNNNCTKTGNIFAVNVERNMDRVQVCCDKQHSDIESYFKDLDESINNISKENNSSAEEGKDSRSHNLGRQVFTDESDFKGNSSESSDSDAFRFRTRKFVKSRRQTLKGVLPRVNSSVKTRQIESNVTSVLDGITNVPSSSNIKLVSDEEMPKVDLKRKMVPVCYDEKRFNVNSNLKDLDKSYFKENNSSAESDKPIHKSNYNSKNLEKKTIGNKSNSKKYEIKDTIGIHKSYEHDNDKDVFPWRNKLYRKQTDTTITKKEKSLLKKKVTLKRKSSPEEKINLSFFDAINGANKIKSKVTEDSQVVKFMGKFEPEVKRQDGTLPLKSVANKIILGKNDLPETESKFMNSRNEGDDKFSVKEFIEPCYYEKHKLTDFDLPQTDNNKCVISDENFGWNEINTGPSKNKNKYRNEFGKCNSRINKYFGNSPEKEDLIESKLFLANRDLLKEASSSIEEPYLAASNLIKQHSLANSLFTNETASNQNAKRGSDEFTCFGYTIICDNHFENYSDSYINSANFRTFKSKESAEGKEISINGKTKCVTDKESQIVNKESEFVRNLSGASSSEVSKCCRQTSDRVKFSVNKRDFENVNNEICVLKRVSNLRENRNLKQYGDEEISGVKVELIGNTGPMCCDVQKSRVKSKFKGLEKLINNNSLAENDKHNEYGSSDNSEKSAVYEKIHLKKLELKVRIPLERLNLSEIRGVKTSESSNFFCIPNFNQNLQSDVGFNTNDKNEINNDLKSTANIVADRYFDNGSSDSPSTGFESDRRLSDIDVLNFNTDSDSSCFKTIKKKEIVNRGGKERQANVRDIVKNCNMVQLKDNMLENNSSMTKKFISSKTGEKSLNRFNNNMKGFSESKLIFENHLRELLKGRSRGERLLVKREKATKGCLETNTKDTGNNSFVDTQFVTSPSTDTEIRNSQNANENLHLKMNDKRDKQIKNNIEIYKTSVSKNNIDFCIPREDNESISSDIVCDTSYPSPQFSPVDEDCSWNSFSDGQDEFEKSRVQGLDALDLLKSDIEGDVSHNETATDHNDQDKLINSKHNCSPDLSKNIKEDSVSQEKQLEIETRMSITDKRRRQKLKNLILRKKNHISGTRNTRHAKNRLLKKSLNIFSKKKKSDFSKTRSETIRVLNDNESNETHVLENMNNVSENKNEQYTISEEQKQRNLGVDIPIVEASSGTEPLHGMFANDNCDFLSVVRLRRNKSIMKNPDHLVDLLKKCLRPLCSEMLQFNTCNNELFCDKKHQIQKNSFDHWQIDDVLQVLNFVLRISEKVSESFLVAILYYLGMHKAKNKILSLSRTVINWKFDDLYYLNNIWVAFLEALQDCKLEKWEAMQDLINHNYSVLSSWKVKKISKLLGLWNLVSSSVTNTWSIVEPLLNIRDFVLHPMILSKVISEVLNTEQKVSRRIYRICASQLLSLSQITGQEIKSKLIQDLVRKLIELDLPKEANQLSFKFLRYNIKHSDNRLEDNNPFSFQSKHPRDSSSAKLLPGCDMGVQSQPVENPKNKVYNEEKYIAAISRALESLNYYTVVLTIIEAFRSKFSFIKSLLVVVFKYIARKKNPILDIKRIFEVLQESSLFVKEYKQLFGALIVSFVIVHAKNFSWDLANVFLSLLNEFHISKYDVEPLFDPPISPIRRAIIYSEIEFYNGRFADATEIFIDFKLLNSPRSWLLKPDSDEDIKRVHIFIHVLMDEFIRRKINEVSVMFFKNILDTQFIFCKPIDLRNFFEPLVYNLLDGTSKNHQIVVELYVCVNTKEPRIPLYGLTIRALLILAYRYKRKDIVSELFERAIEEYAYPNFEEKENTISLLRSGTEEEMLIYITEWFIWFKLRRRDSLTIGHVVQIEFKVSKLDDFIENKNLGIPKILSEVCETYNKAMERLKCALRKCHLDFTTVKGGHKVIIDQRSLTSFLGQIKI